MNNKISKEDIFHILKEFENGNQKIALNKMERYINKNQNDFKTRYNYAVMLEKNGQRQKAIFNYLEVLKKDSNNWRALSNLYLIYFDQKKFSKALDLANKLLHTNPNHQPTLRDKAHIQFYLNDLTEAKKNVELSIQLNSKDFIALNVLGMILDKMGLFVEAKKIYLSAIKINKDYYPTYSNLGKTYLELMDADNAIKILKAGIKINAKFENAYNNLGNAYNRIGEYSDAINIYNKILKNNPNHKEVNSNIALSYFNNKNYSEAEKYFLITKKINPSEMNFKKNYAHFLLYKQDYKQAWSYWDERLKRDEYYIDRKWKNKIRNYIYSGDELKKGEKILIIKEQGIGDEILYSTIYPDLLERFPDSIIETENRLLSLFKRSYNAKNNIVPFLSLSKNESDLSKFDKIIFAGSLGRFFRKELKEFPIKNFLKPSVKSMGYISSILNQFKGKKIGISWKSKREFYGEGKSINLSNFIYLLKLKDCHLINLQYGDTKKEIEEIKKVPNLNFVSLSEIDLMNDFENISALLCSLDLFITVSNSTAHLAGALNVPTLLIKPKSFAIFHYWNQPKNISPWYPSIQLIDQNENTEKILLNYVKKIIEK